MPLVGPRQSLVDSQVMATGCDGPDEVKDIRAPLKPKEVVPKRSSGSE
jgi:hypothetical protein